MNTKLPRAVQAQVDNANRLADEMQAKPPVEPDAPAEDPALPEVTTEVQPAQEAPAVVEPPPKVEDWEHKYRVLQGMFKAEVTRQVESAVQSMKAQNDQLRELVANLQQPTAPQTVPDKTYSFVKAEETEEYGEELLDVVSRKAKEQYLPLIESLQAKIAQLEGTVTQGAQRMNTVEQVTAQTARERFFTQLDKDLPTWETLNVDQGFLSWLDSVDDLTGASRRELFNKAYGQLDAGRVAKFFNAYSASTGAAPAAASAAPPANAMKPNVPLENLQAPGKPRGNAADTAKKFISRAEIAAFYTRQRQGFYRGREADATRFEQEIFAAQAENRIS